MIRCRAACLPVMALPLMLFHVVVLVDAAFAGTDTCRKRALGLILAFKLVWLLVRRRHELDALAVIAITVVAIFVIVLFWGHGLTIAN